MCTLDIYQTFQKMIFPWRISSSEKKYTLEQLDDSDKGETLKPSARDNNSTDTEYSSNLSDTKKQDRTTKKALLKYLRSVNKEEAKAKKKMNIHQTNKSAKQKQKANEVIKSKQDNYQKQIYVSDPDLSYACPVKPSISSVTIRTERSVITVKHLFTY